MRDLIRQKIVDSHLVQYVQWETEANGSLTILDIIMSSY